MRSLHLYSRFVFLALIGLLGAACDDSSGRSEDSGTTLDGESDLDGQITTSPTDTSGGDTSIDPDTDPGDGGGDGTDGDTGMTGVCGDGVLDAGELCDTGIPAGAMGACPSAATCAAVDPCDSAAVVGTECQARCEITAIEMCTDADSCCPAACDSATDTDCSNVCGNGVLEGNERCDTGIAPGQPGACPDAASCTPANSCETVMLTGDACAAECERTPVTACVDGDGCCPGGCDSTNDSECMATCGNGVVEPGESCDTGIPAGQPDACPTAMSCTPADSCETAMVVNMACDATCVRTPVTVCTNGDGCCAPGCDAGNDAECTATCGDGVHEPGELCDTAIPPGQPGACPTNCTPANACETSTLSGAACQAECVTGMVTMCTGGDGCCPGGCDSGNDSDCSPMCGNGVLDPMESCDTGIAPGQPGACPTPMSCMPANSCETAGIVGASCDAQCQRNTITTCTNADGCCAGLCDATNDSDCMPVCGNGVVEPPAELCDTAIPTGIMGACPTAAQCMPSSVCESAVLMGSMCTTQCVRSPITMCVSGDGCCPAGGGCSAAMDSDCGSGGDFLINEFRTWPTVEEAIEVINLSNTTGSLDGWSVHHTSGAGTSIYPINNGLNVPANGYLLLTDSELASGGATSLFANSGAILELVDPMGTTVDAVGYGLYGDAPAPIFSHSTGRVIDGGDTDNDALDFNMDPFPTLGFANDVTAVTLGASPVVVNEFFVHDFLTTVDFVELHNTSNNAVDISGYILIFGGDEEIFDPGTTIPAGGKLVLDEIDFPPFSVLSSTGTMYFFTPFWVRLQQITFGAPGDGPIPTDGSRSVGVTPDGNTLSHFGVPMATQGLGLMLPTPGMSNGPFMP